MSPIQKEPYRKLTAAYMIFGILWILLSDKLTYAIVQSHDAIAFIQMIKGWLYVSISGILVYFLSRRAIIQQETLTADKLKAHRSTISGVQHIFLNYLNQMQVITLEAEKCKDFDPELIAMAKDLSTTASNELKKLETIQDPSAESINSFVYRNL